MDSQEAWPLAAYHTLRTLRRYPRLFAWHVQHGQPGEHEAHREIVDTWLRRISRYLLSTSYRKSNERLRFLMDWAEAYPERQAEALERTWDQTLQSETWPALSPSAKWLYRLIHAMAQELDRMGGSSVLLSNRSALAGIAILGGSNGPRYRSLGIVTHARVELEQAGLVTVQAGQKHEKGKKSCPTRYTLPCDVPTEDSREELNYPPPENRDSSNGSRERVPRFDRHQRASMDEVFSELRSGRATTAEPEPAGQARGEAWDWSHLLDPPSDAAASSAPIWTSDEWSSIYNSMVAYDSMAAPNLCRTSTGLLDVLDGHVVRPRPGSLRYDAHR